MTPWIIYLPLGHQNTAHPQGCGGKLFPPWPIGGIAQLSCLLQRMQLTFHYWPVYQTPCLPPHHPVNMSCRSSGHTLLDSWSVLFYIPRLDLQWLAQGQASTQVAELGNNTNAVRLSAPNAGVCGVLTQVPTAAGNKGLCSGNSYSQHHTAT